MPVASLFTSTATFLYAVSSLLGGMQQNGGFRMPVVTASHRQGLSFSPDPLQQFTPPPLDSPNFFQSMQYEMAAPSGRTSDVSMATSNQVNSNQNQNSPYPPATRGNDPKQRARGLISLLNYRPGSFVGDTNSVPVSQKDERRRHEEEEQAMGIIQQILSQTLRQENRTSISYPDELTYYEKETIATLFLDANGNVTRCRLIEVVEPEDARRVLQMIAERQKRIEYTTFATMLSLITACQDLDPRTPIPMTVNAEDMLKDNQKMFEYPSNSNPNSNLNFSANPNMWSIVSGILPGTKWCGLGDISASYDDLGPERDLDKCCRAHDHCPIKVKAFRSRYGLVNWSIYTKSHCECDSLFYECLKKAAIPTAELLGNFYFNILRVQCVDDEDPTRCGARDPSSGACKLWVPDNNQPRRMLFRTIRRSF